MIPRSALRLLLALPCLFAVPLRAQNGPDEKPRHLKNEQLMVEARRANGLSGSQHPWHVRADFETFGPDGKRTEAGTFEEWWYAAGRYKSSFSSDLLKQTDVATATGLFRSGDPRWMTVSENRIQQLVLDPMSLYPYDPKLNELTDTVRTSGPSRLRCVSLMRKPAPDERPGANLNTNIEQLPNYCFDGDTSVLRIGAGGGGRGVLALNSMVRMGGQYVARDIRYLSNGKLLAVIKITELGNLPADAAPPAPPADAAGPLQGPIELPPGRVRIVGGSRDAFDPIAHELGQNGDVEYEVKYDIGPDGHVKDVTVLNAPKHLVPVMNKSLRHLVFEPFTILGTPVEVTTTVTGKNSVETSRDVAVETGGRGR